MRFIKPLNEKKPKGAPEFHHSDAPDAEGRFKDLGIKDLAAWLIKTRKKDVKKISGSLTQQIVFNRGDDPEYAEKMEKVRKEVYKQLGREDLLDKMDEAAGFQDFDLINSFFYDDFAKFAWRNRKSINKMEHEEKIQYLHDEYYKSHGKKHLDRMKGADETEVGQELHKLLVMDNIIKESVLEGKMPDKYIGNDDIVYLKTKEDSRGAHYNLYYKGHDIDVGGRRFGSEKELEDFASNYILSNQLYRKLRYADAIPLPESVLNEEDSYNDYPAAAGKNAQKAIDWKEKYGRDEVPAGTPVGWARAHQLAKGEKISADTVKRMSAFNRHRKNSKIAPEHKDEPWKDNGYVAWLIWGGDEGVDWAIEKSKEIDAMKEAKQFKYIKPLHEAKFPGRKGDFIKFKDEYFDIKKTAGSTAYVKFPHTASHAFSQVWDSEVTLADEQHKGKRVWLMESNQLNEGYWSSYEYDNWTKENGKPKYPKWVKTTLKEIVKGGFMDPVYDAEHNYMVLWLGSFDNQRRAELSAYEKKGIKEFGKVGYEMVRRFWNDLTGYNMFSMMGAMYALEVSKHIQDRIANGEPVEPAYYMMKEYFNNFGMDTKRSRIFNAAYEKLEKWIKDNNIKTL
jgi:hypothetical protein